MDHQNIARVFDGGTSDSGRPFFVMELVKGIPITRVLRRQPPDSHANGSQLFVPVCQAVQHAHLKGCDPPGHQAFKRFGERSNDGKPVPKVIDFGVAKAMGQKLTERTLFTAFGNVVGTLEYMSPEQADLRMPWTRTRSAISTRWACSCTSFSTGTTPAPARATARRRPYTEVLRLIPREEEPPRPSNRLSSSGRGAAPQIPSAQRKTEPAQSAPAGCAVNWIGS